MNKLIDDYVQTYSPNTSKMAPHLYNNASYENPSSFSNTSDTMLVDHNYDSQNDNKKRRTTINFNLNST